MLGRRDTGARRNPRSVGSAWPGWDSPWWDETAGTPQQEPEFSSWRRERARRRANEREHAVTAHAPVTLARWPRRAWARVRYGRPGWLLARVVVVVAVPLAAQFTVPGDPAVPALAVGACTWLVVTVRLDLAPGRTVDTYGGGQSR
jgi:hypothetical protein